MQNGKTELFGYEILTKGGKCAIITVHAVVVCTAYLPILQGHSTTAAGLCQVLEEEKGSTNPCVSTNHTHDSGMMPKERL